MRGMPIIDCCVYSDWSNQDEVVAYLPKAWQEVFRTGPNPPKGLASSRVDVANPHRNPRGDVLSDSTAMGYPGSLARRDRRRGCRWGAWRQRSSIDLQNP